MSRPGENLSLFDVGIGCVIASVIAGYFTVSNPVHTPVALMARNVVMVMGLIAFEVALFVSGIRGWRARIKDERETSEKSFVHSD